MHGETPFVCFYKFTGLVEIDGNKKATPPPVWLFLENKQQQV